MADTKHPAGAKQAKTPDDGHTRVRISYSPDGFRGVRDLPDAEAHILIDEKRATAAPDEPLGEDEPAGEYPWPASNRNANTSATGSDSPSVTTPGTATTTSSTPSTPATGK